MKRQILTFITIASLFSPLFGGGPSGPMGGWVPKPSKVLNDYARLMRVTQTPFADIQQDTNTDLWLYASGEIPKNITPTRAEEIIRQEGSNFTNSKGNPLILGDTQQTPLIACLDTDVDNCNHTHLKHLLECQADPNIKGFSRLYQEQIFPLHLVIKRTTHLAIEPLLGAGAIVHPFMVDNAIGIRNRFLELAKSGEPDPDWDGFQYKANNAGTIVAVLLRATPFTIQLRQSAPLPEKLRKTVKTILLIRHFAKQHPEGDQTIEAPTEQEGITIWAQLALETVHFIFDGLSYQDIPEYRRECRKPDLRHIINEFV